MRSCLIIVHCEKNHNTYFWKITLYFSQEKLRGDFMIDYSPLWATMEKQQVSQYQLLQGGIDNRTLDSLKKGKNITVLTLQKICTIVGCTPNDVVKF